MPTEPDRQQALRRRHRRERQAVVFGAMIATMAVAALGATAVYTGVVSAPFSREFSTPPPDETQGGALSLQTCPPEGALPVPYGEVVVRVLNGADRAGLAGQTGEALGQRGFQIEETANAPTEYTGIAEVRVGPEGVAAGYTVAAQIAGAVVMLDNRTGTTVDLVLGANYVSLLEPGTIPLVAGVEIGTPAGCVPYAEAVEQLPAAGEEEIEEVTGA